MYFTPYPWRLRSFSIRLARIEHGLTGATSVHAVFGLSVRVVLELCRALLSAAEILHPPITNNS